MFRKMRRIRQELPLDRVEEVLHRGTNGVLAVQGDDGYPYAVPLSYVYHNSKLYFHSAKAGHKVDAIRRQPKVSFAVVDEDTVVSAEYTTYFRSVIAFGRAFVVEDAAERRDAFLALTAKYSADQPREKQEAEVGGCTQAILIGVEIDHMTGKEAVEYVKASQTK